MGSGFFYTKEKTMTSKLTHDGLTIYDLAPQASELWVVAGPIGYSVDEIDADDLPNGFRWVTAEEWESLQKESA
jgi:hypothetical protein